ncbi:Xaa-Pro peptidase family protein [Desulfosporosinus sp. BICA1-9]|uniref:M24 family metallopeptidase n=1 Tax=Desulfosporosinus sp. BICA1-9 TaxID=1531958 RepID=UPI00054C0666|nr:M24 family metallopeptidase [Desulfosporosinus sp. BICA1-9]KJS49001.1 MAG: peptidase M24 [Peptococcaceae bacterium BRH_c23]KJS78071.1 MAG: peptidase M24 [Desulfosporosinus sp. BICA1-9]HBW34140.1 peptidase M24 [Desulfosporosinus sp.]
MSKKREEIAIKEQRLQSLLKENQLDGICLSRAANFAWLTAGGNNRVVWSQETGAAALVVVEGRKFLVAPKNEIERLMKEQAADAGFEPWTYEWYEDRQQAIQKLVGSKKIGSDIPMGNWPVIEAELKRLRFSLTVHEVERAEKLAAICSVELAATCEAIVPGCSEWNIQAELSSRLLNQGVRANVLLVGADERTNFRHPVPEPNRVCHYVIIGLVGEQGGLHLALSRSVYFGTVPEALRQNYESCLAVERAFWENSIVGADSQQIYQQSIKTYTDVGHHEEWKCHHQGGAIGYAPREFRAGEGGQEVIQADQMMAWNPTVENTKCEDTCLVTPTGLKLLTTVPSWWPTITVKVGNSNIQRPLILEKNITIHA